MGWTSTRYKQCNHSEFDNNRVKEFLEREFYDIYQFALIHFYKNEGEADDDYHEIYAIMQNRIQSQPFICVILISIKNDEIFWKEMSEDMGPCYYNCPVKLFKFVLPSADGYAIEWREKCIKNNAPLNRVIL